MRKSNTTHVDLRSRETKSVLIFCNSKLTTSLILKIRPICVAYRKGFDSVLEIIHSLETLKKILLETEAQEECYRTVLLRLISF